MPDMLEMLRRHRSVGTMLGAAALVAAGLVGGSWGAEAAPVTQTVGLSAPKTVTVAKPFTVVARSTPIRKGRKLIVQRRVGARWVALGSGEANARGRVTLKVRIAKAGASRLRTVAVKSGRLPLKAGTPVPVSVKAAGGPTVRVSVSSAEKQGNALAGRPSISGDGRYVAFDSLAGNLVTGDDNGAIDVFLRDLRSGTTTLVSRSAGGSGPGDDTSVSPEISADGRYVVFLSDATDLVAGETNPHRTAYRWDRVTGTTARVSVSLAGGFGDDEGDLEVDVNVDGRFVVLTSQSNNLVAGDTNTFYDVFVRDMTAGTTVRASVSTEGVQGDDNATEAGIDASGRFVLFGSFATTMVAGDTNGERDAFVRDLVTSQTTRVSVSSSGGQANDGTFADDISGDGRYVVMTSIGTNLVAGDGNGDRDVFIHDRATRRTTRVAVTPSGAAPNNVSRDAAISGNGRYVAYSSDADNLVIDDDSSLEDVFVWDRVTGRTVRGSLSTSGAAADRDSFGGELTTDGRALVFASSASNLARGDTNGVTDAFVRELR